jgi:hypothetical protein
MFKKKHKIIKLSCALENLKYSDKNTSPVEGFYEMCLDSLMPLRHLLFKKNKHNKFVLPPNKTLNNLAILLNEKNYRKLEKVTRKWVKKHYSKAINIYKNKKEYDEELITDSRHLLFKVGPNINNSLLDYEVGITANYLIDKYSRK